MTKKQAEYKKLADAGHNMTEIAKITGKSLSTISRTMKRARENDRRGKWISVKEELPPFHTRVLVVSGGKIYVAEELLTWEDGHATIYIPLFNRWRKFSHWMPLPEPPKEE